MLQRSRLNSVHDALVRAREEAESHMRKSDAAGKIWGEETITEIVLANAAPEARSIDFTRGEEASTGADWLWWWVDDSGEAFGFLTQAKRLHVDWTIDFRYNGFRQLNELSDAAAHLGIPDVYSLYLGSAAFRGSPPGTSKWRYAHNVLQLPASAVTVVPAWIVRHYAWRESGQTIASRVIGNSLPLESLAETRQLEDWWWDYAYGAMPGDLEQFLRMPQVGVRQVARSVVNLVYLRRRLGIRAWGPRSTLSLTPDAVFRTILADFSDDDIESPLAWALQGLRTEAPDYVRRAMSTIDASAERYDADGPSQVVPTDLLEDLPPNIGGMTVVRIARENPTQTD